MAKSELTPTQSNRRYGRDSVPFKTYIRPELKAEVAALAERTGASMALLVDDALEEFMEKRRQEAAA